jgi:hypothetical protein
VGQALLVAWPPLRRGLRAARTVERASGRARDALLAVDFRLPVSERVRERV